MSHKIATAIRHVGFEDLGSLALPLRKAGYDVSYVDVGTEDIEAVGEANPDLLVILGGPMGALEEAYYPFLEAELRILKNRLAEDRPTLGICLGAQLMARALGARIYAGSVKEIGWAEIQLTRAGLAGPLRHLDKNPVFHWHSDTFDLPDGCELLASTRVCPTQAFARGRKALGLQFHPEVLAGGIDKWLLSYASELADAGLSPSSIRRDTTTFGPGLECKATAFLSEWLAALS